MNKNGATAIYMVRLKSNKTRKFYVEAPSMGAVDDHFRVLGDQAFVIAQTYGDPSHYPIELTIQ